MFNMKCLNCGAEIKNDLEICPYCGKDIEKSKRTLELIQQADKFPSGCIFIPLVLICFVVYLFIFSDNDNNKPVTQTVQTVQQITESDVYAQNISKAAVIIIDQAVQKTIQKKFSEGLDFDFLGTCVDPMKLGLFTYKNGFEGKASKKEHTYSFRVGTNKLINNGIPKLYYLSVDGETWYFDENGEDKFISASDKALKKALQQK